MKSILITGGSGFLGHGLVEQLLETDIKSIRVFSRNEGNNAALRVRFPDPRLRDPILGDVRDYWRLLRAMDGVEGVIHAAALKRVDNGEEEPHEFALTNETGTYNACMAARECRSVKSFILVSSDKAEAPVNAYGATKLLAEKNVLSFQRHRLSSDPLYHVVRYGNVWGSTGSMAPKWKALRTEGRVVPITALEATRFFMARRTAVNFVLGVMSGPALGQVEIPTNLKAFKVDTAREALGVTNYEIIGMRGDEKMHEYLAPHLCSKDAEMMSVDELRAHDCS